MDVKRWTQTEGGSEQGAVLLATWRVESIWET